MNRPRIPSSLRVASVLAFVVHVGACDHTSHRFDVVDQPEPVPPEVAEPPRKPADPNVDATGTVLPEECTRGTGRNAEGKCVPLSTRKLAFGQMVQIPAAHRFIIGDVPMAYDASKTRGAAALQWPGQPPRDASTPSFWIDVTEVTREAYAACEAAGKCSAPACDPAAALTSKFGPEQLPKLPQTCVSHAQAEAYCAFVGERLPTEVEWEYAARGMDVRLYPWGNDTHDEFLAGLLPINSPVSDASYFGVKGMGTSASEWVSEAYDAEAPLAAYAPKGFRRADGPLRKAMKAAGGASAWVVKHTRVGDRIGASEPDGMIGFRCAADLGDQPSIDVPAGAPDLPIVKQAGSVHLFGGVAEAVDRDEAAAFCEALEVDALGRKWTDWRLPTLAEITAIADVFRGPGPFWTADGAAIQRGSEGRPKPGDPWVAETAEPGEALAARCVHG